MQALLPFLYSVLTVLIILWVIPFVRPYLKKRQQRLKKAAREEQMRTAHLNERMSRKHFAASNNAGVWKEYFKPTTTIKKESQSHNRSKTNRSKSSLKTEKQLDDSKLGEFVNHQPSSGKRSAAKRKNVQPKVATKKSKVENKSSRTFQILKDLVGKTQRNLKSKLTSSLIVNHKWTYIIDDFVVGTILFKPGGDLLFIDPRGSASKGKWELEHALDAICLDFHGDGKLTVMKYDLIDEQGAIMILSANEKAHLFVNDSKLKNMELVRTLSAAMSWINSVNS